MEFKNTWIIIRNGVNLLYAAYVGENKLIGTGANNVVETYADEAAFNARLNDLKYGILEQWQYPGFEKRFSVELAKILQPQWKDRIAAMLGSELPRQYFNNGRCVVMYFNSFEQPDDEQILLHAGAQVENKPQEPIT